MKTVNIKVKVSDGAANNIKAFEDEGASILITKPEHKFGRYVVQLPGFASLELFAKPHTVKMEVEDE
jgi:hypothetical protein